LHTCTHTHTHTHTLAPSILPLLEAPAEGFFWNLPQFGHRIRIDVLYGYKTRPLEAHFQSREKPEVTRSEIRRVQWLDDDRNTCAMQFGGNSVTSGRESGFCITIMHRATHHLLCSNSSPRKAFLSSPNAVLSGSRSGWLLALPYSENGPQGDTFHNHGGYQIEWDGRTPEDSKRSLLPVLPKMAGSMEQVCVHKGPTLKVIR